LLNSHSLCDSVMSPLPPARKAIRGRSRVGAYTMSLNTTTEAMVRKLGLLVGFKPFPRHTSLPVAGSWPVTQSPPRTTISQRSGYLRSCGVEYESGDSRIAATGLSTRHKVLPVFLSIRRTYDGSVVFIPCVT